MRKKLISIVAPMYNEELLVEKYCIETLGALATLRATYDIEIVLVNDGSRDDTYAKMLELQANNKDVISVVNLTRNFGLEGAVHAGLKVAIGDAVVVMDADLQDPPQLICNMVRKWEDGADVVVGSRETRKRDGLFKQFSATLYYKILRLLSGKLILDRSAANYRLLSRKAVMSILEMPEVNPVFRILSPYIGMRTAVVKYDRDGRNAGTTKYKLRDMIRYALDSITGLSIEPLRKLVLVMIVPAVMIVGFVVGGLTAPTEIWAIAYLILTVIAFLFFLLFFMLVLIGEYVGQIMLEVKKRPVSIIYDYKPSGNTQRVRDDGLC